MCKKLEMTRGNFVALLSLLILAFLIVNGWSGLVQSSEVVLMILVATAYVCILPFLLGAAIQAIFQKITIPLYAGWIIALVLVAAQWLFTRKTALRVLEQDMVSIAFSFIIIGIFINAGFKSFRAYFEARKAKNTEQIR